MPGNRAGGRAALPARSVAGLGRPGGGGGAGGRGGAGGASGAGGGGGYGGAGGPVWANGGGKAPPRTPDTTRITQFGTLFGQLPVWGWTVEALVGALEGHNVGSFELSGRLAEDMRAHPWIREALDVRAEFQTCCPFNVTPAGRTVAEQRRGKRCADFVREAWPDIMPPATLRDLHVQELLMGQSVYALDWEERRDGRDRWWLPFVKPWDPTLTAYRQFVDPLSIDGGGYTATTLSHGMLRVEPGGGRWGMFSRRTLRPWLGGIVRVLGESFTGDGYNFRDNQAHQDKWGRGITKLFYPMSMRQAEVNACAASLAEGGGGGVLQCPRGPDGQPLVDAEMMRADGTGWQTFDATEKRILRRILIALLRQDMTTTGSTGIAENDPRALSLWKCREEDAMTYGDARCTTQWEEVGAARKPVPVWEPCDGPIRRHITRWLAYFNFGDFDLAPYVWWDATPPDNYEATATARADRAQKVGSAWASLGSAIKSGVPTDDIDYMVEQMGLGLQRPREDGTVPRTKVQPPPAPAGGGGAAGGGASAGGTGGKGGAGGAPGGKGGAGEAKKPSAERGAGDYSGFLATIQQLRDGGFEPTADVVAQVAAAHGVAPPALRGAPAGGARPFDAGAAAGAAPAGDEARDLAAAGIQVRISAAGAPFHPGHTPGIGPHGFLGGGVGGGGGGSSAMSAVEHLSTAAAYAGKAVGHAGAAGGGGGGSGGGGSSGTTIAQAEEHAAHALAAAHKASEHVGHAAKLGGNAAHGAASVEAAHAAAAQAAAHVQAKKDQVAAIKAKAGAELAKAHKYADAAKKSATFADAMANAKKSGLAAAKVAMAHNKVAELGGGHEALFTHLKDAQSSNAAAHAHAYAMKKTEETKAAAEVGKAAAAEHHYQQAAHHANEAQKHAENAAKATSASEAQHHADLAAAAKAEVAKHHEESIKLVGADKTETWASMAHANKDLLSALDHVDKKKANEAAAKPKIAPTVAPKPLTPASAHGYVGAHGAYVAPPLPDVHDRLANKEYARELIRTDAPFHLQMLAKFVNNSEHPSGIDVQDMHDAVKEHAGGNDVPKAYMDKANAKKVLGKDGTFKKLDSVSESSYRTLDTNSNKTLPPAVRVAAAWYSYHGDGHMNRLLRGQSDKLGDEGKAAAAQVIPHLDAYTRANRLQHDAILYRGMRLDGAVAAKMEKPGSVFQDHAFSSTSSNEHVAHSFADKGGGYDTTRVLVTIEAPKGTHGAYLTPHSHYSSESEFLLARGAKFTTQSSRREGSTLHLTVRVDTPAKAPPAPKAPPGVRDLSRVLAGVAKPS